MSEIRSHQAQESTIPLRKPPHTYLHLTLTVTLGSHHDPQDPLTARTYLTSALTQFLGLTGTAIPIDLLKVTERDVWIRLPREDGGAVVAALGQWANASLGVSLQVVGRSEWLGALN